MKYKPRQLALIIFVSIVLICIPIIGTHEFKSGESIWNSIFFKRKFTATILVVIFFYLNYFYLIPKFYFTKKYMLYYTIVIACFILVVKLPDFIIPDHVLNPDQIPYKKRGGRFAPRRNESFVIRLFFDPNFYQFIISFCISILLRLNMQMSAMNDEKLKSEVSYLKAQINPHFLFNTLNSLYALSLEKSDEAPDAILKLSSIMRYVVTESSNDFVPLKNEMIYIEDYIDLQKLRMVDSTNFKFEKQGNYNNHKIAPLILIPFIENAFKYGLNPEKESFIKILIKVQEPYLELIVENSKTVKNVHEKQKTETGLENTLQRLKYIYPEKYSLSINETATLYKLILKINLK